MTISDQLLLASFAGVPFFTPREEERSGRKVAIHDYPGSDSRFVEDLGLLPSTFNITALIHGFDVIQQRNALTRALQAGEGVFSHPYIGEVTVNPVDWTARTSDSELGQVVYDIQFVRADDAAGLLGSAGGLQGVFQAADDARGALDTVAQIKYQAMRAQRSVQRVGARVNEALGSVQSLVSDVVNPVQDVFNETSKQIASARGQVLSITRTPQRLVTSFSGIFEQFQRVANTPADIAREWQRIANFGSPARFLSNGQRSLTLGTVRLPIARTTSARATEDDNLRVIDQYLRIQGLIGSMEAAADSSFLNRGELADTISQLRDDHERIVLTQSDVIQTSFIGDEILTDQNVTAPGATVSEAVAFSDGLVNDPDLRAKLEVLKARTLSALQGSDTSPFRVSEFDFSVSDIQLAAYQLYANEGDIDTLAALNPNQAHAYLETPFRGLVK